MFEITPRRNESPMRDLMRFITSDPFFGTPMTGAWSEEGTLALDVSTHGDDVVVRASLPGFKRDEIDVQVHDGVLTIKAEHTHETETEDEQFYRRERHFGAVSRRLALPGVVAGDKASAELADGVLTVRIPQAAEAKPKQIAIK